MATMLAVVCTDAALSAGDAHAALKAAADESFNCISVEGHMSTNDTLVLLASGAAGKPPLSGSDLAAFQQALSDLCIELARQIPDDGEGASHLITIDVRGLKSRTDARAMAQSVANSALVKTAVSGGDPNWGRIVSAAGYAGVPFDPAGVSLKVNGHLLYQRGIPVVFDARTVSRSIKDHRETQIELEFSEGSVSLRFWTSDLNPDYVRFNADYTT
jgi:glutamate N-acetyltransferase/amino-acid N-acetyltransferase